ncbi:MAG: carboxypeptidase regulatory-like domain-containing protein [Elusimicrobia bacterium]|nr:carboxypeptidase regulatory-like domain-containing protein [Elusimicrobiota bacterium]
MKNKLSAVISALFFSAVISGLSAIQLTIETGVQGAGVSAMTFDTMGNPQDVTASGITDAQGRVVLNILPNTQYTVFATRHGKGPTVRDQVMERKALQVNTPIDKTLSLFLNEDLTNVGRIRIGVVNISTGVAMMGDIRNVITNEQVAFLSDIPFAVDGNMNPIQRLDPASTGYIFVPNIPAAPENTYVINIFSPKDNKALNKPLALPVIADAYPPVNPATPIYFDFAARDAMAAQTQDTGVAPEGDLAFEGVVVTTNGAGIADMNVQLYSQQQNSFQPKWQTFTMTDSNGRFTFYNVPADTNYNININGLGYEGVNDGPRGVSMTNGNDRINGYTYDGKNKIVVPSNPIPTTYTTEYCYALMPIPHNQYILRTVNGRLKGEVKVGGVPLPFANIQIWGDGDRWQGYDMYSSSGIEWGKASPSNGRIRTGADGKFDITGLSVGNVTLSVWSDLIGINFIYNYKGDWNDKNMDPNTGLRLNDDVRVSISTEVVANDKLPAEWIVYSADGSSDPVHSSPNPVVIDIKTEGTATCKIKGTIKFLEAANIPAENPIVIMAREEFQGDWSTHKSKSIFRTISGVIAKGETRDYEIPVSSGAQYWVDVKAEYWGIVNRFDTQVDFSNVVSGEVVFDFAMASAGKIKGVVRLPDGTIFKPVHDNNNGREISIRANSRISNGDINVPDSGIFEITGLVPGLYNVSIYGSGNGYTWPRTITISDVMVSPGKETYVEIPLTNGVKCEAQAPSPMPSLPAGTTGYYYIVGFNSDDVLNGHQIDTLMDSDSNTPMSFEYSLSTYTQGGSGGQIKSIGWQPTIAAPGRYSLYLIKFEMFGGADDKIYTNGPMRTEHQTITVISQAKNTEIKYDPLQPNVTTYIPFEGAVTGKGKITGKITGNNIWTSADYEKGKKEGQDAMLKNIPTVMLYDINGTWRGFSGARPKNDKESLIPWEVFFMNPNEINKQKTLKDSPPYYYVDMLPPGKYIMVAETPNYPPFMKDIVVYSTATTTLDLDFDALSGNGLTISGVVTSTTGVPLEGAEVVANHKSVQKYTVCNSSGEYSITGLPKGIFRIQVSGNGCALAGDKISIGNSITAENFQLTTADAAIAGTVYSQKIPFAKTLANAKIACYDETYNTQNISKYLPVNKTMTDKSGNYYISGLISGHIYKVYVMSSGKIVEYVEVTPVVGDNVQDFELKSLPPKLKIIVKKTDNPRKYLFLFTSPKKLVAAPVCWYNSGDSYDESKAIQALPLSGPNNTYSLYVNLLETNINHNYNLRVISDDGSGKNNTDDIKFGGNVKRQTKKDVAEGIAEGDSVAIDELGDDNTQIELDAGCLTASSVTVSASPAMGAPAFVIGGFSSNIPSFKLQGTDNSIASQLLSVDAAAVASDVYQVDLANSQMNKSVTLSLNYDKEKVTETDLDKLKIYQYNPDKRLWELVPGVKTIDPISGTVSLDVESIADASKSTSTVRLAGHSIIQNGRFVVNRAASSSQSGVFAVFKSQPSTNVNWTEGFQMFNFPNPFNLTEKIVTLTDGGALGTNLTTKGTIIKYCLPPSLGASVNIKFYIYNLAGELVREIDDGIRDGGYIYYVDWDGRNDRNDKCASGVYFLIAKNGNKSLNKHKPLKLAIIK